MKPTSRAFVMVMAMLLFRMGSAFAICDNEPTDSVKYQYDERLDNVVVTASRTPRFNKDIPVLTQLIPQRQIRLIEPRSFNELLEYTLPGIEFSKHGGQDQLSYRGFSGNSLLFLIDGELIPSGDVSTVEFENINPDNIERVEIIRGAASALYGSNALAGVVNIITKSSREPFRASALASVDISPRGNETLVGQRYHGNVIFNRNSLNSNTSLSYRKSPGYTITDEKGGSNAVFSSDCIEFGQKFSYQPTDQIIIKAGVNHRHRKQVRSKYIHNRFGMTNVSAGAVYAFNDRNSLDLSYNFNTYKRDSVLPLVTEGEKHKKIFNEYLHHVRLQYNLDILEKHLINVGGEYIYDQITAPRMDSPTDAGAKKMHTGVLYGQYSYEPFQYLALSYGGRLDMRNNFGTHFTNRVSVKYIPIDPLVFRATFAQGYRTPSMQELYFYFDHSGMFMVLGNPNLKPEKSSMFLLSGEYNHRRFTVNANAFYTLVYDRINLMPIDNGYTYTNSPSEYNDKILGVDINVKASLPYGFDLSASYAYTHDYYPLMDDEGNRLFDEENRPYMATVTRPHTAVAMASWKHKFTPNYELSVSFATRFLSAFKSPVLTTDEGVKISSYNSATLSKLGVTQKIYKYVDLYLGIDNLFGYQPNRVLFNSPITPGRSFLCNLRFTW